MEAWNGILLKDKKAWKRLDMKSRMKIKIAQSKDGQEKKARHAKEERQWTNEDMEKEDQEKTQEVKRDMQVHLEKMLKTQDGSTVLTYTQFTYKISFTHTKKKPRNEKILTIEA